MNMLKQTFGLFVITTVAACAAPQAQDEAPQDESAVGALQFALTASDDRQQEYRLRNATFRISGWSQNTDEYLNLTVSSEDDPNAEFIRKAILAGNYDVRLEESSWYFERLTENGYERVEEAILLGDNRQYVYVRPDTTSPVTFRFGVDGDQLDFFGGELQIGITVERNVEGDAGVDE